MAIPYNTTNAGTSVRNALRHSSIRTSSGYQHIEDIQVKHSGAWRDTKEVWVKHSGSWRLVHEGEHFLFNVTLNSNNQSDWSLSSYISGQGYGGNKIKGLVTVGGGITRRQMNLGNFSSDSIIYLRIEGGNRIQSRGGNGGNVGNNGANGQRALYTRTKYILDNGGIIAGGGGGGSGGNNSNYTYNVQQAYGCQKGSTCYRETPVTEFVPGGGGGGGAGYPNSNGGAGGDQGYNGGAGNYNSGGSAGPAAQNGTSNVGGVGGNLGQNGGDSPGGGVPGSSGTAIDGWSSYRVGQSGNGDGDIRGPKIN